MKNTFEVIHLKKEKSIVCVLYERNTTIVEKMKVLLSDSPPDSDTHMKGAQMRHIGKRLCI